MTATVQRQAAYPARGATDAAPALDLLRLPLLGRFLHWRHVRFVLQLPLFLLAAVLVLHGLYGPDLAPKNLATLVTWVHYRGLLVLVLLAAGNFFCMGCPFLLPRELARRLFRPIWNWPRLLRNKWLAVALFVLILFAYEVFSLWGAPRWTAWLIIGYFVSALVVDALFKHGSFCKWVCPIGQFNFVASAMSPLEVKVRDTAVCADCRTRGLYPRHAVAGGEQRPAVAAGRVATRLRVGTIPANEGRQYGLHLLPGLCPRLSARQHRRGDANAGRGAAGRCVALRASARFTAARTWRPWC